MKTSHAVIHLTVLAALALGCREDESTESVVPPPMATAEAKTEPAEVDLSTLCYRTDDVEEWPEYDFPVHITFELPPVPPRVMGPFTAEDIPPKE